MFYALTTDAYNALGSYPELVYGLTTSSYGPMTVAWWPNATEDRICYLALHSDVQKATEQLHDLFPRNALTRDDARAKHFAKHFTLHATRPAILMKGTPFFLNVWEALYNTAKGSTLSYGALAALADRPLASRAVGRAMATNPIALIVPCHRVLSATGGLGGYGYGLDLKKRLLDAEKT